MSKLKTVIFAGAVGLVAYNIGHDNPNSITLGPSIRYVKKVEVHTPACPVTKLQKKELDQILNREKRSLDERFAAVKREEVYDPGTWSKKIVDFIGVSATAEQEGFAIEEGASLSNAIGTANSALPFGVVWWTIGTAAMMMLYKKGFEDGKKQK